MTDLDQRIAALREDHNDPSAWSREALGIIDEQAAEIERLNKWAAGYYAQTRATYLEAERLRARVAELEEARMDVIGSNGNDGEHYREVGPTPLRGRITRRTT